MPQMLLISLSVTCNIFILIYNEPYKFMLCNLILLFELNCGLISPVWERINIIQSLWDSFQLIITESPFKVRIWSSARFFPMKPLSSYSLLLLGIL